MPQNDGQAGSTTAQAAKLRGILESAVTAIITIDGKGVIESINPATERLFGYASAELIGQNVKLLMPEPYRVEHDTYIDNYLKTATRKIIGIGREVSGRRKDGATFPIHLSVSEFEADPVRGRPGDARGDARGPAHEHDLAAGRRHLLAFDERALLREVAQPRLDLARLRLKPCRKQHPRPLGSTFAARGGVAEILYAHVFLPALFIHLP